MAHSRPSPAAHPTARLVGQSPAISALRAQIRHLASFDTLGNPYVPTLVLQGETGTGKGLVARLMHDSGPRASGPFVEVNCAAIPETLLEAELFGYEAGAFSEAKRAKPGLMETASGGTLFLDEIDSMPLSLQGKLLTALEAKRVRRLGAVREQAVDVKLIAAAQAELREAVEVGRFRADLFHRLAVVVLALPPLRTLGEDILVLARAYLHRYAAAHRVHPKRLSPAAEAWLLGYPWPGNVRELSHLLERITLLEPAEVVDVQAIERLCLSQPASFATMAPGSSPTDDASLDDTARIQQALQQTGGNVLRAARLLGMSRSSLRYRMLRAGIARPQVAEAGAPPPPPPGTTRSRGAPGHGPPPEIIAAGPPAAWEERPVAVLAVDLTFPQGNNSERPSYEPWTVATRWEQAIREKVEGFGGVLVQHAVAPLLGAFGVPTALEQMPQRAVHAALAIRQLVAEAQVGGSGEPCPEVRLAVHVGTVRTDMQASELPGRVQAVGETLAYPVRLLGHAAPGEILLSPPVGRLVSGWFALQPRPLAAGTGLPGPAGVFTVVGLVPRRSPLAQLEARPLSRFVGRARELAVLRELLAHVEAGRGQVVGIVGEPGMGKSRLLYELRCSLTDTPVTYLEGHCLAYGSATPYLPVLDHLRHNGGITEDDGPEAITQKVQGALQEVGMDPEEWAPYLLPLFGIPVSQERVAALSPQALRARTFETLRQMSLRGSRLRPLLLAVEDGQWIDRTSEDFFTSLVDHLGGVPILFLTTYRPGYRPPWLEKSYATQLTLSPLSPRDSLTVLHSVMGTERVPGSLTTAILSKADGNPFFLEELAQALVDQAIIVREANARSREIMPELKRPMSEMHLPATVQGVLATRIDRLPAGAKTLLSTVAVLGRVFAWTLLRRVVDQPEDELRRLLAQLQAAELLYERPALPEPEYRVKHALIQDVAYAALPDARRRALHARVAQAMEELWHDRLAEHYGELAHHYRHSGNVPKALYYLQQAGQLALQRSANLEAIQHLTTGLALLAMLPETPARTQQELDLQMTLGAAFIAAKGVAAPEVEQAYARARALCVQVGEVPQLLPTLRGLCQFYFARGALSTARELGEQLYRLAQRAAEPTHLLEAHDALGNTLFYLGEYDTAWMHLEQAISLTKAPEQRPLALRHSTAPGVTCLNYAANTLWCLGAPAQALRRSQEALALAGALTHPYSLTVAQHWAAFLHYRRREAPAVQTLGEALLILADEQGFPLWVGFGTFWRGWALAMQGHDPAGMMLMHQGMAAILATGQALSRPLCLVLLAEVAGRAGEVRKGLRMLAEALTAFADSGRGDMLAEAYRLRGELLLRQAAPDAAQVEACFDKALALARRQQAKSWELRAAMSLSRLRQQQGKRHEAHELLAPIYGWFTEGFDTADLQEAKALLDEWS